MKTIIPNTRADQEEDDATMCKQDYTDQKETRKPDLEMDIDADSNDRKDRIA